MPTMLSLCRSLLVARRSFLAAAIPLLAVLSAGVLHAQDYLREGREAAKTWAMHRIAVIQAADGDVQGAKRTISQIDEEGEKGPSDVTAVWFCGGQPVYDHPPKVANRGGRDSRGTQRFFNSDRAGDSVPSEVPPGLPSNYLAADPRHGALIDFTDECDSHGTRVTSRRYSDGHAVIETPHSGSNSR